MDFLDSVGSQEFIHFENVERLTQIFSEYLGILEKLKGKSKKTDDEEICISIQKMAKMYSLCPLDFITNLDHFEIPRKLYSLYEFLPKGIDLNLSNRFKVQLWVLRVSWIFLENYIISQRQDLLLDLIYEWIHYHNIDSDYSYLEESSLLIDLEISMGIFSRLTISNHIGYIAFQNFIEKLNVEPGILKLKNAFKDYILEKSYQKSTKISRVKEIFPEYGEGFILSCLKHYDFDDQVVIMKILEDTLDDKLKIMKDINAENHINVLQRKNVFDNDKFDVFTQNIDTRNVILGKKE